MIRFFTSIGGFLLGALLFAFLLTISFNPNFFAKVMLKDFAKSIAQPATNSLDKFLDEVKKANSGDVVFFAISVEDYELMAFNMQELRRYIREVQEVVIYYRSVTINDKEAIAGEVTK